MKYVKLTAENYNEALKQLREKYGSDAIPISHKNVKEGGLFNNRFFAKDIVELMAAIPEPSLQRPVARKSILDVKVDNDVSDAFSKAGYSSDFNQSESRQPFTRNSSAIRDAEKEIRREAAERQSEFFNKTVSPFDNNGLSGVNGINSVKKEDVVEISPEEYEKLKNFEKEFYDVKANLDRIMQNQKEYQNTGKKEETGFFSDYMKILKENEYTDDEREELIGAVKKSLSEDDRNDKTLIEKSLKDLIKSKIVTSGPVCHSGRKKIVMFVGPTGVGKTTSLAKMGAHLSLRDKKKVAFITIDTYRIAATEQLKKYAEIMRIPIHVVNDRKELKKVIDHEDADVILIDTSGRSHKNTMKISEIKNFADAVDYDFEKILCVSASTKRTDAESIFNAFKPVDCNSVLITKVDETSFVGNIVKVADKYNKPISYIANGQEVPNDLYAADSQNLADMIVNGTPQ
ncbi:MAG: flagellar biosynthesis protein FlhF [Spirochaetes bacterium]|nr:flagellar biosynthesis protein FlhF [Spirochaetota bacterium]MBN2770898.1 flagellar biosynthesis protein FlhF [Spirochaetota bacterium]